MRELAQKELQRVSGGKTDWDKYNARHGIGNGYGHMPNPPTVKDFAQSVGEGAAVGMFIGGPIGAVEGGIVGGASYMVFNAGYNVRNYYF